MKMYIERESLTYMLDEKEYFEGCLDEVIFTEFLVKDNNLFSDIKKKQIIMDAEKEFVKEMVDIHFIESEDDTLCDTNSIYQFIDGVHRMIFLMAHLWDEGKVVGGGFASIQGIYSRDIKWMKQLCQASLEDRAWFDSFKFEPRVIRFLSSDE